MWSSWYKITLSSTPIQEVPASIRTLYQVLLVDLSLWKALDLSMYQVMFSTEVNKGSLELCSTGLVWP